MHLRLQARWTIKKYFPLLSWCLGRLVRVSHSRRWRILILCFVGVAVFIIWLWLLRLQADLPQSLPNHEGFSPNLSVLESQHVMEATDPIHVMFTSDINTLIGTMAVINSIHRNTMRKTTYHILTEASAIPHARQWIQQSSLEDLDIELRVFDTSLVQDKIKIRGGRPELAKPMNYARYLYPEIYPDIWGRFIHVDDDCIVQGDINELYSTHIEPNHLVALSDDCNQIAKEYSLLKQTNYSGYINFNNEKVQKLGIDPSACSFNTGMFVGHMGKWRKENVPGRLLHWLSLNNVEHVYGNEFGGGGSQPPMMLVFYGRYTQINPLWHLQHLGSNLGSRYAQGLPRRAKLLHWNGPHKPWRENANFPELWLEYYIPDPSGNYSLASDNALRKLRNKTFKSRVLPAHIIEGD